MNIPQLPLDSYIALALVIATPWLYHSFSPFSPEKPSKSAKHQALSLLLLVHTLYILYALLVTQSLNIFKSLNLPPSVPPDILRERLLESFDGNVPPYLDILLKRLGLIDLRSLYFRYVRVFFLGGGRTVWLRFLKNRFGHDALTTCSYCQSFNDFAIYAFPTPLLEYIREVAFIGVLSLLLYPLISSIQNNLGPHAAQIHYGTPSSSRSWFYHHTLNDRSVSDTHNPIRNASSRRQH